MSDYINRQVEARARAWGEAKALLDHAASEGRDLTAAESEQYATINTDLDERTAVIDRLQQDEARELRASEIRVPEVAKPSTDNDLLRSLIRGEIRAANFERRQMTTSDDAGLVPETFLSVMQDQMRYTGPFGNEDVGYTILNTTSGEDIKVPTQASFSTAAAVAEAAQFSTSNPGTDSIVLRAHKFGAILTVSRELVEDSGINIVEFLGRQAGNAVGNIVNQRLAIGAGTSEPQGIVTASAEGVVGEAGEGGAFTAEDLISLVHAVDSQYASNRAGFQMSRATLSALRSLQDGNGRFIYDPTQGTQALVLGQPVFENPHVPAIAAEAKSVIFGSMPYYHVRQVGGVEVTRSDDAFFATDLVAFRVSLRVDGNLSQADSVKHFVGGAAS